MRAAETRMGSGKGNVEYWVAVVKPGKILYEVIGINENAAKSALKIAGYKMPVKTRIIKRT
jgi:large subunit ribosomal protein L16